MPSKEVERSDQVQGNLSPDNVFKEDLKKKYERELEIMREDPERAKELEQFKKEMSNPYRSNLYKIRNGHTFIRKWGEMGETPEFDEFENSSAYMSWKPQQRMVLAKRSKSLNYSPKATLTSNSGKTTLTFRPRSKSKSEKRRKTRRSRKQLRNTKRK